jgi:hypothetical protein
VNGFRNLNGGDARQFGRDIRDRREAIEDLRNDLRQQGVNTAELDRLIERLRDLEQNRLGGDPMGLDRLQAEVIEGFKQFEFSLFRQLGVGLAKQPATGMRPDAPAEFKKAVDEYYKSLANTAKPPAARPPR